MPLSIRPALLAAAVALTGLAGCSTAPRFSYTIPEIPEAASGSTEKPGWTYGRLAVAAANPLATDAGLQILRAGGSALDAAIAVQMVLTLVEPQSSGIGGGAFLLHFDGKRVQAFDGRETAPAAATETLFLDAQGKPLPFPDAVASGLSVGVPGAVRMLEQAHRQHGRLPWATLFEPAIALAEQGFAVSPRLHTLIRADAALKQSPTASRYFFLPDGSPLPVGHKLRNPELAQVLRAIARDGSKALHEGPIAQAIVDAVASHPQRPGRLSLADLRSYQPREREALCHDYRARNRDWQICGMPPPSSGAIAIGQILGLLAHTPAAGTAWTTHEGKALPSADWLHLYTEAARLAFADRGQYVADPDFVAAPAGRWTSLLDEAYLKSRAALIQPSGPSMKTAQPGQPTGAKLSYARMPDQPEYGTSHISVVDAQGRAVAMTTTIEQAFGNRQFVRGFLLNNQLTDFSMAPRDAQGRPIANRVEPGKRPRSSMSPTLVFDKATGQLAMSAGSPGGALIIHYTAKTLVGTLERGLTPQQAIDLPNFGSLNGPSLLEQRRFPAALVDTLKARGAEVREMEMTSGLQAIQRVDGKLLGGADPRREGVVLGD